MRRRAARAAAVLALALAGGAGAQPAVPPERLATCMACHGPQGNSQLPNTPSLAGQPRLFLENQLVLIREGLREVPEMKGLLDGLGDPELIALASWFAAQAPVPAAGGAVDRAVHARGEALAGRLLCASCHLPDYRGRDQIPRLAGQQEAFLLQVMKEFRDRPGPGRDTIMAATLRGLDDRALADLAHYLAHFGR